MPRWLSVVLHLVVIGASTTGVIMFPAAAPIIIPAFGSINGLLPSPLSTAISANAVVPPKVTDIKK